MNELRIEKAASGSEVAVIAEALDRVERIMDYLAIKAKVMR